MKTFSAGWSCQMDTLQKLFKTSQKGKQWLYEQIISMSKDAPQPGVVGLRDSLLLSEGDWEYDFRGVKYFLKEL